MAQNMAEHIIQNTYTNDSLYQSYIRTQNGKVHVTDFRMLDEEAYKCNVSLKVPRPVNSFTNHYKRPQEIPPHRMLVTLGENLDRVDRVYQRCLWEDCLDDKGIIRPDYVLKWFNKGLLAYCESLKHSKHKEKLQNELKCDFLEISTETHKDKTIYVQITMGNDENDIDKTSFKINFVPTLTLRHLPNQIKLRAPFPDRQQYFENRDNFRKDVLSDIKRGIPLLCLESRIWMPTKEIGFNKSTSSTWAVGCSSLDAKGIEYISHLTDSTTIENITLLMGKIRHEHLMGLNPVSNPLVCNAILHVHRKNVGKFVRGDQWFLAVLKIIATQLQEHFAPSFFINSMNLLEEWDETYLIWMGNEMKKIVKRLRRKPRLLDFYVGAKRRVGFLLDSSQDLSVEGNETVKENEKLETGLIRNFCNIMFSYRLLEQYYQNNLLIISVPMGSNLIPIQFDIFLFLIVSFQLGSARSGLYSVFN
ncbi:hypothetical protein FSP39_022230 [Pinctada imbricata]|uniref:Uncharacterized protein n=1 Tax=Pinctada imbricata TaxID=66713 RepID=A0AA88XQQ3_PINIB|nr:hypothetical protein FSP39_022230 [Pinctada imbricata]